MSSAITVRQELEAVEATLTRQSDVQSVMDLLTDADCRAILAATTDEALTARELSEALELPLSTTYRKLDGLTDAGLLAEGTRFDSGGSHPSEYHCVVDDVVVSVASESGATLTVVRRSHAEGPRLAGQ